MNYLNLITVSTFLNEAWLSSQLEDISSSLLREKILPMF